MKIKAKYASVCPGCGRSIRVGDTVEWEKGSKARHVGCSSTGARKASAKSSAPRRSRDPRPIADGERQIGRRSTGRDDGYDVGQVIHLKSSDEYVVVTAAGKYRDDDSDEWMLWGYVRTATEQEAAPSRARIEAKAARKERLGELTGLVRSVETLTDERVPAGSRKIEPQAGDVGIWWNAAGSSLIYLGSDGAVWATTSSYDDGPRAWRTTNARAVELATLLLG